MLQKGTKRLNQLFQKNEKRDVPPLTMTKNREIKRMITLTNLINSAIFFFLFAYDKLLDNIFILLELKTPSKKIKR